MTATDEINYEQQYTEIMSGQPWKLKEIALGKKKSKAALLLHSFLSDYYHYDKVSITFYL